MFMTRQDSRMLNQREWDYIRDQLGIQFVINMCEIDALISELKRAQVECSPSKLFYSASIPRHLL